MGRAEDALRARRNDGASELAAEEESAARDKQARARALYDEVRPLVSRALTALQQAGYPGGLLLDVEDLDRKIGFGSKRRYAREETAAWQLFDDGHKGDTGSWFSDPVYLASNGKLIITRHGLTRSRFSAAGHYYLALDRLDWNRSIDRQIDFLQQIRTGLKSVV